MSSSGTPQRPSPLQLGLGIVVVVAFLVLLSGLVWPGWMLGHPIWGPSTSATPIASTPVAESADKISVVATPCAPCATASINASTVVTEPIQLKDMQDALGYPVMVKYKVGSGFYCTACAKGAAMPAGHVPIERWDRGQGDGNYLHNSGDYSMAAFCSDDPVAKHFAPAGTKWTMGLLEIDGFKPATFPLK